MQHYFCFWSLWLEDFSVHLSTSTWFTFATSCVFQPLMHLATVCVSLCGTSRWRLAPTAICLRSSQFQKHTGAPWLVTYIAELHLPAAATRGDVKAGLLFSCNSDKGRTTRSGIVSRMDMEVYDSKNILFEFQDRQISQIQQLTVAFSVKCQV